MPEGRAHSPREDGRLLGPFGAKAAQVGQYANVGTVTGTTEGLGTTVSDTDPSHYFGVQGKIDVEKFTNDVDADQAPGPFIPVGDPVTWTYTVKNNGNSTLSNVTVTDVDETPPDVSATCQETTLAIGDDRAARRRPARRRPASTRTSRSPAGRRRPGSPRSTSTRRTTSVPTPGILIEKSTNGVDADERPGRAIPVGQPVEWTYTVTNTGNETLTGVTVTDDQGVTVTCPATRWPPARR